MSQWDVFIVVFVSENSYNAGKWHRLRFSFDRVCEAAGGKQVPNEMFL